MRLNCAIIKFSLRRYLGHRLEWEITPRRSQESVWGYIFSRIEGTFSKFCRQKLSCKKFETFSVTLHDPSSTVQSILKKTVNRHTLRNKILIRRWDTQTWNFIIYDNMIKRTQYCRISHQVGLGYAWTCLRKWKQTAPHSLYSTKCMGAGFFML